MVRSVLLLCLLLTALASATLAAAAPGAARIVVLAHDGTTPELAQRVRAELSAMGFVVTELIRDVQPSSGELLAITRQARAVATLLSTPEGVEIWVIDPETERTGYHERILAAAGDAPEIPGLRAVEILRAQITRWRLAESNRLKPPARPPPRPRAPPPWATKTWIGVGPALSLSAGGVGFLSHVGGSLAVEPAESLRLGAFGVAGLASRELRVPAGKIEVQLSMAAVFLEVPLVRSPVGVSLGGGGGVVVVKLDGKPEAQRYEGRVDTLTTGIGFGQVSFFYPLGKSWCLRSDFRFGASSGRVAIQSLSKTEANWGRPFALGMLGIEVKLP